MSEELLNKIQVVVGVGFSILNGIGFLTTIGIATWQEIKEWNKQSKTANHIDTGRHSIETNLSQFMVHNGTHLICF